VSLRTSTAPSLSRPSGIFGDVVERHPALVVLGLLVALLGEGLGVSCFRVLGPVEAWTDERRLVLGGPRQVALLAFLLLHANRAVSADALIDAVWGSERDGAAKRLQMGVLRLRRSLAALDDQDGSRLRTVSGGYLLSVRPGELDAEVFAERVREGRRVLEEDDPARASGLLGESLGLWRGPPLAEVAFEDFAQAEIRRLEELRLVALETRIDADLQLGHHGGLIPELEARLAEQPTRERIAGQLMTALYRSGRQTDALEVYQRTRAHLAKELGLDPGPALRTLRDQILGQDAVLAEPGSSSITTAGGLEHDGPGFLAGASVAHRSVRPSNLPTPATALVGRAQEVSLALELLATREVRLLTLWGPGGSGKTRLALDVAARALSRYRNGAWIVLLAPIPNRELMVAELARVLDVPPVPGESLERTLVRGLTGREMLIVLDNFEHLLEASDVVAELLANAPGVDVLSTTREPLRIRGEQRMEVPPLQVDDAAELLVARAKAVRPDLTIDQDDRATIERICERLDGLPLALEIAAARVAVFSPRRLEARLAKRLTLPEGPRDLPERQRTLRATIGWSHRLLDRAERDLLASLSPFVGGVRIDAAESIWGDGAVDGLISLAEKSLLRRREDPDGEPRFWMLETIRQFALEEATSDGSAKEAADCHATHFLALSGEAAAQLLTRAQKGWLHRLEADHSNLRAALLYLAERSPERAVQMAANLEWFWIVRGHVVEGRNLLEAALAAATADSPSRARAAAAAGQMAVQLGEAAAARPRLLEALSLAEHTRQPRVAVLALSHLGWAAEALGDPDDAATRHQQAIAIARNAGDRWVLGLALNNYGILLARAGELERARPILEESLDLGHRTGEPQVIALAVNNLAEIAVNLGDLDQADALSTEALTHAREVGFRGTIASALHIRIEILLKRGDLEMANTNLKEAVSLALASHLPEAAPSLLSTAGTMAAMRGHPLRAVKLWAAADEFRARVATAESPTTGALRAAYESGARAAVGDASRWAAAWAAGNAMSLHDALALANDDDNDREASQTISLPAQRGASALAE
jgi:predicted ATPase/DNA-binding SARP family transcriptional activator/Tfp pilus assembly protein PilF